MCVYLKKMDDYRSVWFLKIITAGIGGIERNCLLTSDTNVSALANAIPTIR